jgi:hypothetical protein
MDTTSEQAESNEVCFVNIGPKERQKRLIGGLMSLGIGLVIVVAAIALGATPWARLAAFPFFYFAGNGIFQWRDKT